MSQEIVMLTPNELQALVNNSVRLAIREELKNFSQTAEVMREKEAAKYLGVSANTLRQYRVQGVGPAYSKNGTVIFYTKKDLDVYLQEAKIKTYNKG